MATNKTSIVTRVKNMFFPGVSGHLPPNKTQQSPLGATIQNVGKELNRYRGPVQVVRIKIDPSYWRNSVIEAERPLPALPYRVMMQTMYMDTVLNGHVAACMQKRKNLTLLKKFYICDENGVEDEAATRLLQTDWFDLIRNYIHDARYYGYSLVSFGDMVDSAFPNVQLTRRTDISPDRLVLSSFQYVPTGIPFMQKSAIGDDGFSYYDWSLYVPTPSENGVSVCGYGLLYKVAYYELILRALTGWNTDYTERYGQPTLVIKTAKDSEDERGKAEEAAQQLGSSGYMIMDRMDEFEFAEVKDGGTGWQSYDNLEMRCKKTISSVLLGHEDAISSTPGKLGSGQGSEGLDSSPVAQALAECESIDSKFEEFVVNNHLIPKLINLGIKLPVGKYYKLKNDAEEQQEKTKEAEVAKSWADIAKTMSEAGMKIDINEFIEKSGVKAEEVEVVEVPKMDSNIKAKLTRTYSAHVH